MSLLVPRGRCITVDVGKAITLYGRQPNNVQLHLWSNLKLERQRGSEVASPAFEKYIDRLGTSSVSSSLILPSFEHVRCPIPVAREAPCTDEHPQMMKA
jgi:hypothetical protein